MNVLIKKTLLTTIGIILMIAILALKQHVYTCPSKLGQHFFLSPFNFVYFGIDLLLNLCV